MSQVAALLLGAGMSVVTGVVTWWITRHRSLLDEKRRMKRGHLTTLISFRHDLQGDDFTGALNGASIVFADSPSVRDALREFHDVIVSRRDDALANRRLLDLFHAMLEDLDLPVGDFSDEFLLQPFNVRSTSLSPGRGPTP